MKVVILCGGFGTRLSEETAANPKPMVEIGGMPILWHIMKTYAHYGFNEFVLCLGYKGHIIKDYFYHYDTLSNDFTIELGSKDITVHPRHAEKGWKITLVDTGEKAMTGARIKRIEEFIEGDTFMLTYGDGVANININELLEFHRQNSGNRSSSGRIVTLTGVVPQSQYGELRFEGDQVKFNEKPTDHNDMINGGYFVLDREVFNYLKGADDYILEKDFLQCHANLLNVYRHQGFWQCMDTRRDYLLLQKLWQEGNAPWKVW